MTEDSNPDCIKGVIHANSLVRLITDGPTASIRDLVRNALVVPETKPLDTLLAELRRTRNSIAVVADEYGRTAGVVAVEDIVGEISDETEPAAGPVRTLADGQWLVRGDVTVADLRDYGIELDFVSETYNSMAGLILDTVGHLPKTGDSLTIGGFSITIEAVRDHRIDLVRISRVATHQAPRTRSSGRSRRA